MPQPVLEPSLLLGRRTPRPDDGAGAAARLDAAGSAARLGIPFSIHSDAPVTPLGPLFTAWCAVNRLSSSGRLLGPEERLSVAQALHAVTLGAAYTLRMDHLVGSIEAGKFADFAVLDADPLETPPEALREISVHATVLGGPGLQSAVGMRRRPPLLASGTLCP